MGEAGTIKASLTPPEWTCNICVQQAWSRAGRAQRERRPRVHRDRAGRADAHEFPPVEGKRGWSFSVFVPKQHVRDEWAKWITRRPRQRDMLDADRMIELAGAQHRPDRIFPTIDAQNETDLRRIRADNYLDRVSIRSEKLRLVDEQALEGRLRQIGRSIAPPRRQQIARERNECTGLVEQKVGEAGQC